MTGMRGGNRLLRKAPNDRDASLASGVIGVDDWRARAFS